MTPGYSPRSLGLSIFCGRSEDLRRRVEKVAGVPGGGNVTIKAIGFTSEMHELMAAADLLVGKPGGLTTSEALARGLALVVEKRQHDDL